MVKIFTGQKRFTIFTGKKKRLTFLLVKKFKISTGKKGISFN